MAYYVAASAAARQVAVARAAAEQRQMYLLKKAATANSRLAAAEQAYKEGDVRVASRIYVTLALSRRQDPIAVEAKQRLAQLADEARLMLRQLDAKLAGKEDALSPSESGGLGGSIDPEQPIIRWEDLVAATFREYDQIAEDYGGVPAVKRELKTHVAKQRRQAEFAAVLNEPEAKALWELGQHHEEEDQQCCAYWVYKQAARLAPAASARRSGDRLAEMEQDPQIVASAETCRELQLCHRIYNRAEKLAKVKPARAKELFKQIVERAPKDSEVCRGAQRHIQEMSQ